MMGPLPSLEDPVFRKLICETGVQEKRQRLDLQLAAAHSRVVGDVARVQQVFWNLLKNVIKFTPEGGSIFVNSRNENNHVVVEVSDSGIGIDSRIIQKIFVERGKSGE
jgi:signal transduction histidine kinase